MEHLPSKVALRHQTPPPQPLSTSSQTHPQHSALQAGRHVVFCKSSKLLGRSRLFLGQLVADNIRQALGTLTHSLDRFQTSSIQILEGCLWALIATLVALHAVVPPCTNFFCVKRSPPQLTPILSDLQLSRQRYPASNTPELQCWDSP